MELVGLWGWLLDIDRYSLDHSYRKGRAKGLQEACVRVDGQVLSEFRIL